MVRFCFHFAFVELFLNYLLKENYQEIVAISGMPDVKPMVVSIWFGRGKPILNEFLKPFVAELNEIWTNGIRINGHELKISDVFFICDSPARAYIKGKNFAYTLKCTLR